MSTPTSTRSASTSQLTFPSSSSVTLSVSPESISSSFMSTTLSESPSTTTSESESPTSTSSPLFTTSTAMSGSTSSLTQTSSLDSSSSFSSTSLSPSSSSILSSVSSQISSQSTTISSISTTTTVSSVSITTSSISTTTSSTSTTSSLITPPTISPSTFSERTSTPTESPSSTREISPTTTFHTTFFVTATDSRSIGTRPPSIITTVIVSTASDGVVVTVTEVQVNHQQTLSPDNNNSNKSSFFRNTGAVAGVFVLVGLAAASILLWIFFAVRRRRRTQRLEHDTAVSATLAAVGFHRTPLDDDDDDRINSSRRSRFGSVEMNQRSSSGFANGTISSTPSGGRASAYMDSPNPDDQDAFNPYTDYVVPSGTRDGYTPGRTSSPPPNPFYNGPYRERTGSGSGSAGEHVVSHSASHSAGSYEPLLASFHHGSSHIQHTGSPSPSHSPQQLPNTGKLPPSTALGTGSPEPNLDNFGSSDPPLYSSRSTGDNRLDPGLRQRLPEVVNHVSAQDLRDDEDYSRPVLGVRNLPDTTRHSSHES